MKLTIREVGQGAPVLDEQALLIFQKQWQTYQRLLDLDYLSHKEVLGILRSILLTECKQPFSFLDLACGDAFGITDMLSGTQIASYLGIDLSAPALELAAKRLGKLSCPVELVYGDIVAGLDQMSIRFGQALIGDHLRLPRNKAFAITFSLRITTVRASFPGFPARLS